MTLTDWRMDGAMKGAWSRPTSAATEQYDGTTEQASAWPGVRDLGTSLLRCLRSRTDA